MEKDAPKLTLEITEFDLKSRGEQRSGNGSLLMDGGSTTYHHHQVGVGNQDMVYDSSSGGNGAAAGVGGGSIYDPHRGGMMVPRSGFAPGVPPGAIHPNMNTR